HKEASRMKPLIQVGLILLCLLLAKEANAQDTLDALDSLRVEAVRSRGFIRAAETQLTKVLNQIDGIDELRTDTVYVPIPDTFEVIVTDTTWISERIDSLEAVLEDRDRTIAMLWDEVDSLYALPPDTLWRTEWDTLIVRDTLTVTDTLEVVK